MNEQIAPTPPTYTDIAQAAARIAGHAVLTPLLQSPALDAHVGGRVLIKPETLQRTGSFKFRGAYNKISHLIESGRRPSRIVAYSSGNHAQGVASAAALHGLPATIVMPKDAPAIKIANTRGYGAEVVTYDRYTESREEVAARIASEPGTALIRPYDDPDIIAGQGTAGREIAAQAAALGLQPNALYLPTGGGGLTAGVALALANDCPGCAVYGVEPAGFDDTCRSLKSGTRVANDPDARSICDALLAPTPGELTFAINARLLKGALSVSDDEVRRAMAYAFEWLKLVVEPGGSVALAALLAGKIDVKNRTIVIVLSGGNVDPELFAEALRVK
jgi:threonine dehydratase